MQRTSEKYIGKKFGHLTILDYGEPAITKTGGYQSTFIMQCDCENHTLVTRTVNSVKNSINKNRNMHCGCHGKTNFIDLTGKRFGAWLVLERAANKVYDNNRSYTRWKCLCDPEFGGCGAIKEISASSLRCGDSQSCGCIDSTYAQTQRNHVHTHNMSHSRLYRIYYGMISRCYRTATKEYPNYGGRGIYICDEWYKPGEKGNPGFLAFYKWAMENGHHDPLPDEPRNKWLSIDRKDNDGPYAPWNCQWVDQFVQANNQRTTHKIEINGELLSYHKIETRYGLSRGYIYNHLQNGWCIEMIIYSILHQDLNIHKQGEKYLTSSGDEVTI